MSDNKVMFRNIESKYCPLVEDFIDDGICFDIHMVVESDAPDWTAPEKAVKHKDRNQICKTCKYQRND